MFFEENVQTNGYSISEIMEYLIQKLESRYNSIIKFNELLDTYNSPEDFFSLRKDFKLLFNDLEEGFKQGIFTIKALTAQNKQLTDDLTTKTKENKKITDQLNKTLNENKNIKLQLIKLKDKKPPEVKKENINFKKDTNKKEAFDIIEKGNENEIENNNINYSYKNNNNFNNNNEIKQSEKLKNKDFELEQLSNVRNIMDNMKKNKMKLKMAIEQHFTNNQDK